MSLSITIPSSSNPTNPTPSNGKGRASEARRFRRRRAGRDAQAFDEVDPLTSGERSGIASSSAAAAAIPQAPNTFSSPSSSLASSSPSALSLSLSSSLSSRTRTTSYRANRLSAEWDDLERERESERGADVYDGGAGREGRLPLLSPSLASSEYTVVDVGRPDQPRLISCVRASQGFDWNVEMFLPSYISRRHSGATELETRPDPVSEIVLTDEDITSVFPDQV